MKKQSSKISEINDHLLLLTQEVGHLRRVARREIEENWSKLTEAYSSPFQEWQASIKAEWCCGFAHNPQGWSILAGMSCGSNSPLTDLTPEAHNGREIENLLRAKGFENTAFQLGLSHSSKDLEVCFLEQTICLPIVLFDNLQGFILAKVEFSGDKVRDYRLLQQTSAHFLSHLRSNLFQGYERGVIASAS